ncbi:DNA internalization-related competence protein ComEC/Rec2 [Endothiovibrio diazotrophicus]
MAAALAFLVGVLILYRLPELPNLLWGLAALPLLPLAFRRPPLRLPLALLGGFLWASLHAHFALQARLDPALDGARVVAEGRVASIPERSGRRLRFVFDVAALDGEEVAPLRTRISWFDAADAPRAGERWRLRLRLKSPRGLSNPGGFDYEGWLFQQGIGATGYVRDGDNRRLSAAPWWSLDAFRQRLAEGIEGGGGGGRRAVLAALAVGYRGGIERPTWEVFTATGTSHLIAISGLHIGLVAGFAFLLGRWLWSRSAWTSLRLPAPLAGAWVALAAACGYAALAGFSIPTRRALVMVAVVMVALIARRRVAPSRGLALALGAVLLVDPPAVLAPGFWLSFMAVAVLLFGLGIGGGGEGGRASPWRKWGRAQWLIFVGLAPLLLLWFGQLSLAAPLANLLAVPWVSVAVVPPALTGALLLPLWERGGQLLLHLADHAFGELWPLLEWLAAQPAAAWRMASPEPLPLVLAALGAALLVAPRGVPLRGFGALLLLPLLAFAPPRPEAGRFRATMLDVGQGLSVVVETARHTLVYDTGPRYAGGFDTGRAVVVPYLRSRGVGRVDRLVVSHAAADHAGGVASLLQALPVASVIGGDRRAGRRCVAGERWRWDGVTFRVLHPPTGVSPRDNDGSCVLQVRGAWGSLLLTGDLEAAGERQLLSRWGRSLHSDLLQVPHHGSATSSTAAFIEQVAPRYALFSVGYRNRFGFPRPAVVERYRERGSEILLSSVRGALIFEPGPQAPPPPGWREARRKFWSAPSAGE